MREQAQLIRVNHPQLGSYEADLIRVYPLPGEVDHVTYTAYLLLSEESVPFTIGERVVLKWIESTQNGRGVIAAISDESVEGEELSGWKTFKLSISMNDQSLNLRHYPRLLGGLELFYAQVDLIEDPEHWLQEPKRVDHLKEDPRFYTPLDPLMNFSVSGLSFESGESLNTSQMLLCAIGLSGEESLTGCLGKVVRCHPSGDHFVIAISFISPPPKLTHILSTFTLKLQRIETEGGHDEI